MDNQIREGIKILDNVTVVLEDFNTGAKRSFSSHNIALNHAFSVFSQWLAGGNNTGQNAIQWPTAIALGSGSGTPAVTDTGLFTPIPGATANVSYVNANTPTNGTTSFVFQIAAGIVTVEVTEAFLQDANSAGFAHTMFDAPFTPSPTETITITWEYSFGA